MSYNAHELSNRLLNALDSNYNVIDMRTVSEIISILEKFNITKELLETTRLGKHVNELRRKTADPTLARRAKVLVKRWRDLVIPAVASPAHTGSNRSSAERQVRRLGGTPLTSPALSRVVSPAVSSPRLPSRPTWGGYESDSQDVILVDDDPPPPAPLAPPTPLAHKPITPPVKRPPSPEPLYDEKKAKRDKKPKKKRSHSRAGSGVEAAAAGGEAPHTPHTPHPPPAAHAWGARNGSAGRRPNGLRRDAADPYAALVHRLPPAGAKKVKTTKELLEQIQSRGKAASRATSPASPASPDVMVIEDVCPITVKSPLRNGGTEPKHDPEPKPEPVILPPLEEEREWAECTCGEEQSESCPAAVKTALRPLHVWALHNAYVPGLNGTRAPPEPHKFAVRPVRQPDRPDLFTSVVPLYNYSDYADDYCVKNMSQVPLCPHIPWTSFAPAPPSPPPPKSPPPLRPYPSPTHETVDIKLECTEEAPEAKVKEKVEYDKSLPIVKAEMVGIPILEPSERLKAPLLSTEDEKQFDSERRVCESVVKVEKQFVSESPEHRTVERTKVDLDGRMLYSLCETALRTVRYGYEQAASAPIVTLPPLPEIDGSCDPATEVQARETLEKALEEATETTTRDDFGRPTRPSSFAEWHECARLGDLIALPYVVID